MKSGNLNFLEPSGPLQACNRTDLPFTFLIGVGWVIALQPGGMSRVRFPMESLRICIDEISGHTTGPGVDSASNRNEYQEDLLGVNAAGA
jgi:hypothetical protein